MTMMMSILPGEGYAAFWAFNIMIRYHNRGHHPSHSLIFLQNTMTKNHHDWLKIINIKQKFANSISPAGQLLFHWPILHTETKKFGQFGANIIIFAINEHAVCSKRKMGHIYWIGIHTNPQTSWQRIFKLRPRVWKQFDHNK